MKLFRTCASVALALAAASCFSGYRTAADSNLLRVRRGTFASDVVLTGELRAARGEELAVPRLPQWQTTIKWIAPDGAEMKQGDRVVELDNSVFSTNLDAKRQAVAQAQQELQQKDAEWTADTLDKQLDVERKRSDYDKTKLDAAMPKEIISARDFNDRQVKFKRAEVELAKAIDVLKSQRRSVKSDRDNLLLNLQKAQRELTIADRAINELILRAPHDGIVVIRDHPWEGRRLQEGDGVFVGLTLAQFPEMSSLRVEADLADVDDGRIGEGMPATVVLDAYPGMSFPGRVTSISAVAQESSRTSLRRAFKVMIALDRLDPSRMRPGLSSRVVIRSMTQPNALLVPRAALDYATAKPRVHLANGKTADVVLGACNAQECIVKSGLNEGDTLARVVASAQTERATLSACHSEPGGAPEGQSTARNPQLLAAHPSAVAAGDSSPCSTPPG
ncbi:MAG TPA: HlyD family efflux transporter periplasmic adaptor subunit, partial [Thermoanaerobaculia bacterium]|nr:HlyD family efflux transporter periplasmic adaptor subunit [Thermoanaerobaculia bacterium]